MRKVITSAIAVALAALGAVVGVPAHAGTPVSPGCDNGAGEEHPIITNPITLSIQRDSTSIGICYSTTPLGAPGGITGGGIAVYWNVNAGTTTVTTNAWCLPDDGVVFGPTCTVNTTGVSGGTPGVSTATMTYVADTGGPCLWVLGTQYLPTCTGSASVTIDRADGPNVAGGVTPGAPPPGGSCIVQVGSMCTVSLTLIKVTAGCDPGPTVVIDTTPTGPKPVDLPKEC
jgi:hypothetical protein